MYNQKSFCKGNPVCNDLFLSCTDANSKFRRYELQKCSYAVNPDLIASEDTRQPQKSLNHFWKSIHPKRFNMNIIIKNIVPQLIALLKEGEKRLLQVSDAVMPSIEAILDMS